MRFKTHLVTSALTGLALYRRAPRRAALLTLAGVALDIDHYLLYAWRSGDWDPRGALRYNGWRHQRPRPNDPRPRYGSLRSIVHYPSLTLPLAWLAAWRWPALRPMALGVSLHLALDTPWALLLDGRVWRRAGLRCEACGKRNHTLRVHYWLRPAWGGDPRALNNRVLWCAACERARRKREFAGYVLNRQDAKNAKILKILE